MILSLKKIYHNFAHISDSYLQAFKFIFYFLSSS